MVRGLETGWSRPFATVRLFTNEPRHILRASNPAFADIIAGERLRLLPEGGSWQRAVSSAKLAGHPIHVHPLHGGNQAVAMDFDTLFNEDCIAGMKRLPDGCADLVFADPPFNIGYEYDSYDDSREAREYLDWSRQWTAEVVRLLKPNGTFWLAIGDEFAAELKVMLTHDCRLYCRNWVVWYYTFGVNCTKKFTRSHAHLFYFVKHRKKFTFNADDPAIRVPSARQLVYGDRRANPKGRLPDDTWVLRPQDLPEGFQPNEDTWYFSRVCGTFKERAGWHGCQMPEQLLGRIVRATSRPGDLVLDPFAGSGTTLAVARKLGRKYLGFELSKQYCRQVEQRLAAVAPGDPLDGPADPARSAPATAEGVRLEDRQKRPRKRYVRKRGSVA